MAPIGGGEPAWSVVHTTTTTSGTPTITRRINLDDAFTTTTNGLIYNPPYIGSGTVVTSPGTVSPFTPSTNPWPATPTGLAKLTPEQAAQVANHQFMPMEGNLFCLLCYALDTYRMEEDHGFVIREE